MPSINFDTELEVPSAVADFITTHPCTDCFQYIETLNDRPVDYVLVD